MKHWLKQCLFENRFLNLNRYLAQANLHAEPLAVAPNARLLILAPHPDDESIGCGGLLLQYPGQCEVVCITDGGLGGSSQIRAEEFRQAMAMAGVEKSRMLNIPDGQLAQGYAVLSQALDMNAYDMVFLPNPIDQHADHRALAVLMKKLLQEKPYLPGVKIAFYEVWTALGLTNAYVDISHHIDQKRQLIDCHQSQVKQLDYADKILALNTYRGLMHNLEACEAYSVVDVDTFLDFKN